MAAAPEAIHLIVLLRAAAMKEALRSRCDAECTAPRIAAPQCMKRHSRRTDM